MEVYILDENNQKITVIDKPQFITVVLKTQGKIGKNIKSLSLYNEEYDYVYEGKVFKKTTIPLKKLPERRRLKYLRKNSGKLMEG